MKKLYTKEELLKKFSNVYINIYPLHYEKKDEMGNWITVYELRGSSKKIRENYNSPKEWFKS